MTSHLPRHDITPEPAASPGPLQLEVRELQEPDHGAWDAFVHQQPHATPFHLLAWKRSIEETFSYRAVYLFATEGERIRGVLPLFLVQNPIIGKALISTPFAVYGGILADCQPAIRSLYERAVEIGNELGVGYVEFRNTRREQCVGEPNVDRYVSFSQELVPEESAILENLPKKTRNMVRKALKEPFMMCYGVSDLRPFMDLYARNMRRLGTPCFPPSYFARLVKNFGDMVDVREVRLDGKPMAASLNFLYRGEMHVYYAAADTRHNALAPNTYMYYDHLRWGGGAGFRTFDFGRCKRGTGVFEFKRHWNTTMRELPYEVVLIRRRQLPNFSPTNSRFELAIWLWRHLPLWVTRLLGPRLVRLFP